MKVAVLGAGRVGRAMALDLARDAEFQVTVVDRSREALDALASTPAIRTVEADLSDPATVRKIMKDQEMGVGAVPGFMGLKTLQAVLEAGRPAVDIAFFPEDPFILDGLARRSGLRPRTASATARMCSGPVPQHPPTSEAPSSTARRANRAR